MDVPPCPFADDVMQIVFQCADLARDVLSGAHFDPLAVRTKLVSSRQWPPVPLAPDEFTVTNE